MAVVNKFNVNNKQVTLDANIIEDMSANDVSYDNSFQYNENTVGEKLSELNKQVIYDVTANNGGATFTSLSELLSSENLSTLIPIDIRCGGMSIRFVQSSDNKYVQYRLMADEWSTTITDWQGVDDNPTADSDNLVKSGGVYEELETIDKKIEGITKSRQYSITQGEALDTSSNFNRLFIDIPANTEFEVEIDYPNNKGKAANVRFFRGEQNTRKSLYTGFKTIFKQTEVYDSISIYIPAESAVSSGTITVSVKILDSLEERIERIEPKVVLLQNTKADIIKIGNNLFNRESSENLSNKYIDSQGIFTDSPNVSYHISHVILMEPGESVYINIFDSGVSGIAALYYDIEHTRVIAKLSNTGYITNTSQQRGYLYVTFTDNIAGLLMVNKGTSAVPYEPYIEGNVLYDTSEFCQYIEKDLIGVESKSVKYNVQQGVALNTTSPNFRHYVEIPANRDFTALINYEEADNSKLLDIYFFVGNIMKYRFPIYNKVSKDFNITDSITAIGFSISAENAVANGTVQLTVNTESIIDSISDKIEEIVNNSWGNLNIVIMGDSITWLGGDNCDSVSGWTKWFKDKAEPLSCKSYARSGATITNLNTTEYNIIENVNWTTKDNVFYNQINRLIYDYDNDLQVAPDVLIIALGTNDYSRPRTPDADTVFTTDISSYTTGESVTTMLSVAQAMRYGVEMLYTKFPNLQILFLAPQQSTLSTFEDRLGVGDEIEKSCRYMGIPCLRLDYEAATWLIRENVSYYKTTDGTHTSEIGAKRNGYLIENWARTKLQYL